MNHKVTKPPSRRDTGSPGLRANNPTLSSIQKSKIHSFLPLFCLLAALLVPAAAWAAPDADRPGRRIDLPAALADAAGLTTNRYPDADTVLADSVYTALYNPDGTGTAWNEDLVKILTEAGRRDSQTQSYHFNVAYGTALVTRAWIFKPDGRCVTVDVARASRIMTETSQMGSNIYDPANKVLQLSLAGVEVNDVVYTESFRETFKARVPDVWSDYSLFEYTAPIRRMTYAVSIPDGRPLRHERLRGVEGERVAKSVTQIPGGRELHQWDTRDVPQIFPEPGMPPLHTVVQRLILSTAEDWPALSRWYWNLCQPRLAAVTPAMAAQVTNLVAGAVTNEEKVRRIFTWVSQNIRYMGITTETEAPGYEPHDVSMTFENRYGVCRDKAALLVAMFRLAGLESYPVLIHVGARLDPDVPMTFFNHAIVAVKDPTDGKYQLMDPTNENTRDLFPAYLGNRSYLVAHPEGETLHVSPVSPAEANLVRVRSKGSLDETGRLTLQSEIAFEGINDSSYRGFFARQPREQRRRFFEGLVKARLAGAELTAFEMFPEDLQDTTRPLTVRLEAQTRGFLVEGDDRVVADLPWLSGSLGFANQLLGATGLRQRRFDLETELACGTEEALAIDLGTATGAPLLLPEKIARSEIGIRFGREVAVTNGVLNARLQFLLEKPLYPAADYATLKQIRRDMEFASRQRVHLAPGPLAAAPDLLILDDELRVELASAACWTSTHRRVQQVLTYAGTKRAAEIKLPFNPAWQTAELVSAVVSNVDGRVHNIKPEEINLMDAAWTGGAPRYPAARILVASLPGVETGSVITVTTRFTQRDAPFFDLQAALRSFDPISRLAVEVTAPCALPLRMAEAGSGVHYLRREDGAADRVTHRWEVRDQAAVPREETLPPAFAFLPTVRLSTGDWQNYARLLRQASREALSDGRQAQLLARKMVAGVDDPLGKVLIIRDFVMRTVRPAGPSFAELPTFLTPVDRTLADGYGHDFDRGLVMVAMLRAVGIDAEALVVDSSQRDSALAAGDHAFPRRLHFDTCLVAARPRTGLWKRLFSPGSSSRASWVGEGLPIYLNDSDQYGILGTTPYVNHPALALDGGESGTVEVGELYRPLTENAWEIDLSADGTAEIAVVNRFSGAACGSFRKRFREMLPEPRARYFQELVGGVSQAAEAVGELETDLESYPGVQRFRVHAQRYAVRQDDTLTLLAPGGGSLFGLRSDRRENPLWLKGDGSDSVWTASIVLPDGDWKVVVAPPEMRWDLPADLGTVTCKTSQRRLDDGRLEIGLRRHVALRDAFVPPELYPALLEMDRRLNHPGMRTVVARGGK